jgi:hypothetical protein
MGFLFVNFVTSMKRAFILILFLFYASLFTASVNAQCSVCTKTVGQMGEKPARGLNQGILYLMFAPFAIVGVVGYRWWKYNRHTGE